MSHSIPSQLLNLHLENASRSASGSIGFGLLNADGEILDFSPSLCEILDAKAETTTDASLSDFFSDDDTEAINSIVECCGHEGISSCDARVAADEKRWLRLILSRITCPEDTEESSLPIESAAILALVYDCTGMHSRALREEEQRLFLRQILDINPSFIFAKDREGRFTLVNEAIAKAYGTTVEGLIGKTDADFNSNAEEVRQFREDDLEVMDQLLEKRIDAEPVTNSEGEVRWVQTVKRPIIGENGRADQMLGVATDITERRFAEQMLENIALVVSRGTGSDLFQSILVSLLSTFTELQSVVLLRFPTSQSAEECTIRSKDEASAISEPMVKEALRSKLSAEGSVWFEGPLDTYISGNGVPPEGFLFAVEIPGEKKSARGVYIAVGKTAVSRRGAFESAMQIFAARTASELERIEADAVRREMEQNLQHTQKLESLGVLAGGIAHDFNNLLMAMLGNASLALHDCRDDSPLVPRLKNIKKSAERASILTNQLLAYSGKATLQKSAVNLSSLVEEMGELLHTALSKGAVLDIQCDPSLPLIHADTAQLQQIVMNCITNASDALDGALGTIQVKTMKGRFQPDPDAWTFQSADDDEAEGVILKVRDSGQGMTQETIDHIFDPFFTTKFTGRGLGLAAVLGIVRGHNGAIAVSSKQGIGSEFQIFFPASEESGPTLISDATARDASTSWRGEGEILVVDDEQPVRTVACSLLEVLGFDTFAVDSGAAAISLFRSEPRRFSAVLLDLTMPEMSGVEVHRELKKINSEIPIMISSGYAESRSALGALCEEDNFLQKPYTLIQLMRKMRALLDA